MNNKDYTAVKNTATETVSEYKIGHTLYTVKTVFMIICQITLQRMESQDYLVKRNSTNMAV